MKTRLEDKLAASLREAKRKETSAASPSLPATRKKKEDARIRVLPARRVWPD